MRPSLLVSLAVCTTLLVALIATNLTDSPAALAQAPVALATHYEPLRQWGNRPPLQPPLGEFNLIYGLAFDAAGQLYAVDRVNHRVQVLDRDGHAVRALGWLGNGPGELYLPVHIAVASDGTVYVTDEGNQSVVRFAADGAALRSWTGFDHPFGIGVGRDDAVYVGDTTGITRLTPDGASRQVITHEPTFSLKVKREGDADVVYAFVAGGVVRKYGATGTTLATWDDFSPYVPFDLDVDAAGNLYVTASRFTSPGGDHWVVVRAVDGAVQRWSGYYRPRGLVIGPDERLYVSDGDIEVRAGAPYPQRIQRRTLQGERVTPAWGGEETAAPGQLLSPLTIAASPSGDVWVYDLHHSRFVRYTSDGVFVSQFTRLFTEPVRGTGHLQVDDEGRLWVADGCHIYRLAPSGDVLRTLEGSPGCRPVPLDDPALAFRGATGFDFDKAGALYVADYEYKAVVKLDAEGHLALVYQQPSRIPNPFDLAIDRDRERIYILTEYRASDYPGTQTKIVSYSLAGVYNATWTIPLGGAGRPTALISHIEVDSHGALYASDVESGTVWKLDPTTGAPLARIEPGGKGVGPGQFDQLYGLGETFSVAANGEVYTVEGYPNGRVQVFGEVANPTPTPTPTASPTPRVFTLWLPLITRDEGQ